jgi:hypothetical protein
MTIEKKSLISSLKTTKKANVAASTPAKKESVTKKSKTNYAQGRNALRTRTF